MKVKDLMLLKNEFAVLDESVFFKDALDAMNKSKLGIACLVDNNNNLIGIITDGDIRRKLLYDQKPLSSLLVDDAIIHAIKSPIICDENDTIDHALILMDNNKIWDLPVCDESGKLKGLLHLHNAIKILLNK